MCVIEEPGVFPGFSLEIVMRPVSRRSVNKGRSARQFRGNTMRTRAANMNTAPMRGGIRL